jgi:hypothetical protein
MINLIFLVKKHIYLINKNYRIPFLVKKNTIFDIKSNYVQIFYIDKIYY